MKLRNFLYLNNEMLDSYIAAIDGGVHNSEIVTQTRANQKSGGLRANIGVVSGNAQAGKGRNEKIKKNVQISPSAKFSRLYDYLQNEGQAEYYQSLNDDIFTKLGRDDFVEVLVKPRFSKMKEIANFAKSFGVVADVVQELTGETAIDMKGKQDLANISRLNELKPSKTISCVFSFDDDAFPIVADLDEQYFKVAQDSFIGEVYVLCKIQRKLQNGEKVELDEIFEQFQRIPLNREQRRQFSKKDLKNPKQLKDVINGPALTASVVAVYQ